MGFLTIDGRTADCGLAAGDRPGRCHWCGRVRPARRKRWCSDRCGFLFYANHRWADAREVAKARAGFKCERCGASPLEGLEVHHRVEVDPGQGYGRLSCVHHQANLEVLDLACHRSEHSFRHEVDRLVTWADGHVSRQLVLPGIAA